MLKEVFASNAAKLMAACVCPVVATGTIVMEVPKVRAAVHHVTAPKSKAKPQAVAARKAAKPPELARSETLNAPPPMCQSPVVLHDASLEPSLSPPTLPEIQMEIRTERVLVPAACPSVGVGGGVLTTGVGMVPEPATWAQMIAGFALLGGALRLGRRRTARFA